MNEEEMEGDKIYRVLITSLKESNISLTDRMFDVVLNTIKGVECIGLSKEESIMLNSKRSGYKESDIQNVLDEIRY